jgi:deoxyribonuclease-4
MKELLFGTAGTPISSADKSTVSGIKRIKELKLDCMEVQFVRGVRMGGKNGRESQKDG